MVAACTLGPRKGEDFTDLVHVCEILRCEVFAAGANAVATHRQVLIRRWICATYLPGSVSLLFLGFSVCPECITDFDVTRVVLIGCALHPADVLSLQFLHMNDNDGAAAAADCLYQVSVGNPHLPGSAVCV